MKFGQDGENLVDILKKRSKLIRLVAAVDRCQKQKKIMTNYRRRIYKSYIWSEVDDSRKEIDSEIFRNSKRMNRDGDDDINWEDSCIIWSWIL